MTKGKITWNQFENWFTGEAAFKTDYTDWAINELKNNPSRNASDYFDNKHIDYIDGGESNVVYEEGGYDESVAPDIDLSQENEWNNISPVIPATMFERWDGTNCFLLAKKIIEKAGYTLSDYDAKDSYGEKQTINVFDGEVNLNEVKRGINYLHFALKRGIPIVVGVDNKPGHPGNRDNITDHFVVIVGMGNDANGNYFRFFDVGSNTFANGTSTNNKLYYNATTGKIEGKGAVNYSNSTQKATYIMTMIRRSKPKK